MRKFFGRFHYNSPVTLTFALISFISLLLGIGTKGFTTGLLFCVYRSSWLSPFTYLRLFGHVLGHENWAHFSSNMLLFLVLGPVLEEKYGSKNFLNMIVITAFVSGLFYILFYPNVALMGASGIVFMMIVLASEGGMKEGRIPITLLLVLFIYLGGEVMNTIAPKDSIAHVAHIIGGICGASFGFINMRKIR